MFLLGCQRHFHPPFSFRSCRKENGPWTVQKKRTLGAELAPQAQVRLNTGVVLADCHQFFSLLPARAVLVPRIGFPRVYTAAVIAGGYRKARPPGPADATLERQRKEKQRVSGRSKPPHNPRRAGLFLRIGFPRVYTAAVVAGGHRKDRTPGPADAAPALPGERQRKAPQGVSGKSKPPLTPRRGQRLSGLLPKLSHRETFFLFHRARRIFFLMSQKENGGCIPRRQSRRPPSPRRGRRITQTNSP